jgi:adhesin transport system membrane fusion protein
MVKNLKLLKRWELIVKKNKRLSAKDYEFMHSLSAAVLQVTPSKLKIVLYFWIVTIAAMIAWAYFAVIDEIVRGNGEIIPSGENQIIQNLEGGIVEKVLVKEGESVKQGQVLVKIDNQKSQSSFSSNAIKADALEAKILRLEAESSGKKFKATKDMMDRFPQFIQNEKSLYATNMQKQNSKIQTLKEQLTQRRNELSEAKTKLTHLKKSLDMIQKEVKMTRPMVLRGVSSKVDFLKLQREANQIDQEYSSVEQSIPRLKSAIYEVENNIKEIEYLFQSEAKIKLNEALSELETLRANSTALEDQVSRTVVRSPMHGIVQEIFVHTVGGVIKPGAEIMEIVPSGQTLLVEVKIKPSDIAFIYLGQRAKVKFSAYDFSIYGGLDGEVVHISADTIKDDKDEVFYTVRIKTDKNYLERNGKHLKIIPGMTVNVDIMTGQKSVLDYILKPILKTKQYTFTER